MNGKKAGMIRPRMAEPQQAFFAQLPTLLVGTADKSGRPWASVLVGQPGFLQPIEQNTLRVQARPLYGDPLQAALVDGGQIGTLGLDLPARTRVRLNGTLANVSRDGFDIRVAQAHGNCDSYIQTREPELVRDLGAIGERRPVRRAEALNKSEAALIARCDTFFIATQASGTVHCFSQE